MEPEDLLTFILKHMRPSSFFQPLIIRSLIQSGGSMHRDELARVLLLHDQFALAKSRRTLMRWPKSTLSKHGVIDYDRPTKMFRLRAIVRDKEESRQIIDACDTVIQNWQRKEAPKVASRFYAVIEAAEGRCQACGIPGWIRPIDVDHIVPRNKAVKGFVTVRRVRMAVDDPRNLQALCTRCNRGKRDSSTTDYTPSLERLNETIRLVVERGVRLGYERNELLDKL